jgi:hypothetical protein
MTARIRHIRIDQLRLDPAEAELRIDVETEGGGPATEARGRWVGPRCALRSTVDVAYSLRPVEASYRVLIPEPALWEPASPFLYDGIIELWEDGQRLDRHVVVHGLKTLSVSAHGLRLNHKQLELRGVVRSQLSEAEARLLKEQGVNLLMGDAALESLADRLGFLLLRRALDGHCHLTAGGAPGIGKGMTMQKQGSRWELRATRGALLGTIEE